MNKKVLIICASVHHGNTLKVAKAIAEILNARIITPADFDFDGLNDYDLIGFGSGIYNQKHHESIFYLVAKLPSQDHQKAFVFSTNTFGIKKLHEPLKEKLAKKGFEVVPEEFSCPGFIDFGFTKYFFGGINKKRPNEADLKNAKEFAQKLLA